MIVSESYQRSPQSGSSHDFPDYSHLFPDRTVT
jgi:hypothetical protein